MPGRYAPGWCRSLSSSQHGRGARGAAAATDSGILQGMDARGAPVASPSARSPLFAPYYALVVLSASAWLLTHPPALDPLPWTGLAVTLLLMVLSDLVPVRITGGGFVTPGASLDFAALLLFGGPWTAALNVASTLIAQGLARRQKPQRMIFNIALYVLMIAAADLVFRSLGGRPGPLELPGHGPAPAARAITPLPGHGPRPPPAPPLPRA